MKSFIKMIIPALICLGIMIVSIVASGSFSANAYEKYKYAEGEVTFMQEKVDMVKKSGGTSSASSKVLGTMNIDSARFTRDKGLLANFFDKVFNWNNGDEYDAARKTLIETIGENNKTLNSFFIENKWNEDHSKSTVEVLGVNMKYEESNVYITETGDDKYSYICEVVYSSHDFTGNNGKGAFLVEASIDKEGNFKDVNMTAYSKDTNVKIWKQNN